MLGDWESHLIPPGVLSDMSPRHAPEIRFRPHYCEGCAAGVDQEHLPDCSVWLQILRSGH